METINSHTNKRYMFMKVIMERKNIDLNVGEIPLIQKDTQ